MKSYSYAFSTKIVFNAIHNSHLLFTWIYHFQDVITGLKYGRFGREDSTLVMTTKRGGLLVKILKRSSQFEDKDLVKGPPAAQNQKLNVPKKTKVFVDQTMRERENGICEYLPIHMQVFASEIQFYYLVSNFNMTTRFQSQKVLSAF